MTMNRIAAAAATLVLAFAAPHVHAGPYSDKLMQCLSESTTGKDRTDLVRWIYVQMSRHPSLTTLSQVPADVQERADRETAALLTRLLGDACASQARDTLQHEGQQALRPAFESLGRVAMQELMINTDVAAGFVNFTRYMDTQKLDAALKPQTDGK